MAPPCLFFWSDQAREQVAHVSRRGKVLLVGQGAGTAEKLAAVGLQRHKRERSENLLVSESPQVERRGAIVSHEAGGWPRQARNDVAGGAARQATTTAGQAWRSCMRRRRMHTMRSVSTVGRLTRTPSARNSARRGHQGSGTALQAARPFAIQAASPGQACLKRLRSGSGPIHDLSGPNWAPSAGRGTAGSLFPCLVICPAHPCSEQRTPPRGLRRGRRGACERKPSR